MSISRLTRLQHALASLGIFPGGGGGSGESSASLTHQTSVTFDNDQIKAWPTGPLKLLNAPGSNRIAIPTSGLMLCSFPDPYSNISTSSQDARGQLIVVYGEGWDDDALPFWDSGAISGGATLSNILSDGRYLLFPPIWYRGASPIAVLSPYPYAQGDTANAELWVYLFNFGDGGVHLGALTDGGINNAVTWSLEFEVFDLTEGKRLTTVESGWDPDTRTFS